MIIDKNSVKLIRDLVKNLKVLECTIERVVLKDI